MMFGEETDLESPSAVCRLVMLIRYLVAARTLPACLHTQFQVWTFASLPQLVHRLYISLNVQSKMPYAGGIDASTSLLAISMDWILDST